MLVYAGIDEAGYGPLFGPLLVGCTVLSLPEREPDAALPDLWDLLGEAVCRTLAEKKGRLGCIAVNDSKKLHNSSSKAGIRHLELGALAFAAAAGHRPLMEDAWLDCLGETAHRQLDGLPWYAPDADHPWRPLPRQCTPGEIAVARSMLTRAAQAAGVRVLNVGAAVVFEDQFNRMVATTRSKASTSFTFVARHLKAIWDQYAQHQPVVVVDRQSGRQHYREILAQCIPDTAIQILDESDQVSRYRLVDTSRPRHAMTVSFEVDSEVRHMPVAVASMISKYTRELMMSRFQGWWSHRLPRIKPTAGYGADAKRFWQELHPCLDALSIRPDQVLRQH